MSAGCPYRCTGEDGPVRGVMAASIARRVDVVGRCVAVPTGTGVAPAWLTASQVAM